MEAASESPLVLAKLLYAGNAIVMLMYDPLGTAKLSARLDLAQRAAYSVKIWLADALLIYRLWIVWVGSFMVIVLPCILFVGTIATGVAGVALYYEHDKLHPIVNLGVSFHTCSVALNVLVTVLIAGKLLYQRWLVKDMGEDHGRQYLSLLAVFAESGALYGIVGIIYIPLYATGNNAVFILAALLEAASGIAPALIILRMALGVAVSRKTQAPLSTIKFRDREKGRTEFSFGPNTSSVAQTSTVPSSHRTCVDESNHRSFSDEGYHSEGLRSESHRD